MKGAKRVLDLAGKILKIQMTRRNESQKATKHDQTSGSARSIRIPGSRI